MGGAAGNCLRRHHDGSLASSGRTLDRDDPAPTPGDPLPPLWHWLYFLPVHRMSELGADGHARLGGFLPPVELPSRMWAGSRLEFERPLRAGDAVRRVSTIQSITPKQGRTGALVFVVVRHEISGPEGRAIVEEHDIVYRDHPKPNDPRPEPKAAPRVRPGFASLFPTTSCSFRYSALTFNGHRIHYDRRYCTDVEHYPGLVMHGPLLATLLLDLVRRQQPDARVGRFQFRAVSTLYDDAPFALCGMPAGSDIRLWARKGQGAVGHGRDGHTGLRPASATM